MKRWLLWTALGFGLVLGGMVIAVFVLVDAEAVRGLVVKQATQALGRKVEVGQLEVVLFPQPAVRLAGLMIEGDAGAPTFVEAESLSLSIALLPLLTGSIELDSVELDRPTVRLPVDAEGLPVPPDFSGDTRAKADSARKGDPAQASRSSAAAAGDGAAADSTRSEDGAIRLAIEEISLRGGRFEAGEWQLAELDVSGDFDLSDASEFTASAELPGLGQLRDMQFRLDGIGGAELAVDAELELRDFQLAVLAKRLRLSPDPIQKLSGILSGPLQIGLRGDELSVAKGQLELRDLDLASGGARIVGTVPIRFELGGDAEIDLTPAEVGFEESVRKPSGERLLVAARLGRSLGPEVLRELTLGIGPNDVPISAQLDKGRLTVSPSVIEIEPIAGWVDTGGRKLAGALRISKPLQIGLDPLRINGEAKLEAVRVAVENGDAVLSGPVVASGKSIRFEQVSAVVGDQEAKLLGGYDLDAGTLDFDLAMQKADMDALLRAVTGESQFAGALGVELALRGKPSLEELEGGGTFSIRPGELRGFSLLRQVLGPLANVAEQVLRARGKDLSRYEQEKFELLEGKVRLSRGVLTIERLQLDYEYASASLSGTASLIGDRALDLVGTIRLPKEVASDVLRTETDRPLVLSDVPVRGTLTSPRVMLDPRVLAQIVGTFAARNAVGDKLEEKLRERLGSQEDVDAVKGLLEGVLGGRRKRDP